MIKMILIDHGIIAIFSEDTYFNKTKKGIWLEDNNIDYRISEDGFKKFPSIKLYGEMSISISVDIIQFFNEEDFIAFKLRWGN